MSDAIVRLSPAEKSKRINDLHRATRHRPGKKVPVTGRSARYYQRALYPDRDMLPAIRARGGRLLDLGSGCNHLHPSLVPEKTRNPSTDTHHSIESLRAIDTVGCVL